ncbi:MAG: sugar ABC transporter permease [Ruminococcaceae bacterium]|nr:sugar ABC transporter permease [Oscillospiraceae bacterium]
MKTTITPQKKLVRSRIINEYVPWILGLPAILCILICSWQPLIRGIVLSFFDLTGYDVTGFAGLDNYKAVLGDHLFVKCLVNTFEYLIWSLIIGFIPPIAVAFMINELMHGKRVFRFITYLPSLVSIVAIAIIWTTVFRPGENGTANALLVKLGLPMSKWFEDVRITIPMLIFASTWQGMGSTALMFFASLQSVNGELYEAALIDGAGICRRIWHVTLPQIRGMVLLMFVQQIIAVFQIMVQPMKMTSGGPMNESITLCLQSYYYAFRDFQIEKSLALGVITGLILLVLTGFYHVMNKKLSD